MKEGAIKKHYAPIRIQCVNAFVNKNFFYEFSSVHNKLITLYFFHRVCPFESNVLSYNNHDFFFGGGGKCDHGAKTFNVYLLTTSILYHTKILLTLGGGQNDVLARTIYYWVGNRSPFPPGSGRKRKSERERERKRERK